MASSFKTLLNSVLATVWLFLVGFCRGLRWDRCIVYFVRDPLIFSKTASCIVLNGAVFFGSIKVLRWVIRPAVARLLATAGTSGAGLRAFDALYAMLWLLPAYVISMFVSYMWYGEIAERTALAAQHDAQQQLVNAAGVMAPASNRLVQVRRRDTIAALSQELYRLLLFGLYFLLASAAAWLPLIGSAVSFFMFSCLYSLYCFDYKWSLHGVALEHRTQAVEQHWAYFSGYGAVMIAVGTLMPFFEGAAVVGVMFPLSIVAAADANAKEAYLQVRQWFAARGGAVKFVRLPIFGLAVRLCNALLSGVSLLPRALSRSSSTAKRGVAGQRPRRT